MLSIGSGNLILSTGHWHYGTWSPLDIDMMGAATGFRPAPQSDQLPWCIGAMYWLQCFGCNALVALVAMHWCNALVAMVVTGQWWEHRPPLNLIDCLAQFQIAGDSNLLWGARVTPTNLTQVRQPLQILLTLIRIWAQPLNPHLLERQSVLACRASRERENFPDHVLPATIKLLPEGFEVW